MIKVALFDYGGVLTPSGGKGGVLRTWALIYGIDEANLQLDDLHMKLRRGLITDEAFFAELNRRHPGEAKATKEAFWERADLLKRNEEMYGLAEALRANGIKTGILSNVYAMTAHLLRENGRYDGFDPVVLSCEEHLVKPAKEFFEIAIQKSGVRPSEILFIDDQEKSIPTAQNLGLFTILLESPQQAVRDTVQLLKAENDLDLELS